MAAQFDPENELMELSVELSILPAQAREFQQFYNSNYAAYGNEVYQRGETRLAHWLNFLEGGWFQRRFDLALPYVRRASLVIDLGFSVPYWYSHPDLRASGSPQFCFVEKELSAFTFYRALTRIHQWQELTSRDSLLTADLDSFTGRSAVEQYASSKVSNALLFVASEVIEHLDSADDTWAMMRRISAETTKGECYTYITLPIGARIPSHKLEFRTEEHAKDYLAGRMELLETTCIRPDLGLPSSPYLEKCVCAIGRVRA